MTSTLKIYALVLFAGFALVSCKKEGCTDPMAINYNSNANHDDGSCNYDNSGSGGGGGGGSMNITDNVTTPTTWSGTVSVCGNISVDAALTISPGTVLIMCAGAALDVTATGSLNAVGTPTSPINISGEVQTPGFWDGIKFNSNNPNNQLAYVTVRDAGSYWGFDYANIFVNSQSQVGINNCTISNSDNIGLSADNDATFSSFSNNTFSNNGTVGVKIHASQIGMMDELSAFNVNNGENFIQVESETVNSNQTWKKTSVPLMFNGKTTVESAINVNPGVVMQFEANAGIEVSGAGSFAANGTSAQPITMQGRFTAAGYWAAISFLTNNPNNALTYVNISDGGQYWGSGYSGVFLNSNGRLAINNCTISNCNSWGMYVNSGCTVTCNGVTQTDAAGVLTYNTMTGNGAGPDANCSTGGCTVYFE